MTCQQPVNRQGAKACMMGGYLIETLLLSLTMGVFSLWIYDIKEEVKMSIKRLEECEASVVAKSLYGLVLKKGEKNRLYDICLKYRISITYPNLFSDDTHYYLW